MTLKHPPSGHLDNLSAIETILSRFEDDVVRQQDLSAWLHGIVDTAEGVMDGDDYGCDVTVEDIFHPDDGTHFCIPMCEGGCADCRRRARATCQARIPGGASILA